jgi:hypothetical protein
MRHEFAPERLGEDGLKPFSDALYRLLPFLMRVPPAAVRPGALARPAALKPFRFQRLAVRF